MKKLFKEVVKTLKGLILILFTEISYIIRNRTN